MGSRAGLAGVAVLGGAIAAVACGAAYARSEDPDASTEVPSSPLEGGSIEPPQGCPSSGRRCTPAPPDGWQGPFLLFEGDPKVAPPCPLRMPEQRDRGNGTPSGSVRCGACECGPPKGATCSATLFSFPTADCNSQAISAPITTCAAGPAPPFNVRAIKITTEGNGGTCVPSSGAPEKGDVTWSTLVRACGAPSLLTDGCAAGELCTPEPPAPFRAQHCIASDRDMACPAPWTVKIVTYESINDTRGCSGASCKCGEPRAVECTGTLDYFSTTRDCTGASSPLPVPRETCFPVGSTSSGRVSDAGLVGENGSCSPSGTPTPTGGVAPNDPSTVCCLP